MCGAPIIMLRLLGPMLPIEPLRGPWRGDLPMK